MAFAFKNFVFVESMDFWLVQLYFTHSLCYRCALSLFHSLPSLLRRKSIRYTDSSEKFFFRCATGKSFPMHCFFVSSFFLIQFLLVWLGWVGRKKNAIHLVVGRSVGRMDKSLCITDLKYSCLDCCRQTQHAKERIIASRL